ncbi:MAG: polysaccharide biosynthesis protein [Acidobacteria bacterium]|nr:MAG: polysaccharide biosynthesis protein [Acidobacteriota bacterium]
MYGPSEEVTPDPNPGDVAGDSPLAFRIIRGGLWVALTQLWTIVFGFAANIALTRLLSPQVFGTFALGMFFAQLLRVQPKLGLGYAFGRRSETETKSVTTYATLELIAAALTPLLALLAVPVLLWLGYPRDVVRVCMALALGFFLEGIVAIGMVLMDKKLAFSTVCLIQGIIFPFSYLPAFWLAANGGGAWSLVAQTVTFSALSLVGIWVAVGKHYPRLRSASWGFDARLARELLRYGLTVGLGLAAAGLLTQLDNFLIGTFVSLTVLGFYDRAYRTAQWPTILFQGLLSRAAFMSYAKLKEDRPRLQKTLTMVLWLISFLALPVVLAVFIAAPDLIALLYGPTWLPSTVFLRILVVFAVAAPLFNNAGTLLVAVGRPEISTRVSVLQVIILGAAGFPLTLLWGGIGTCVAVGLAFAVGLTIIYSYTIRELPIRLWAILGKPVLISLFVVIGYVAFDHMVEPSRVGSPALRVIAKFAYTVTSFYGLTFLLDWRATSERLAYVWRLMLGKHAGRADS